MSAGYAERNQELMVLTGVTARRLARRGTTNGNARGSTEDRRRRREWLVKTYRANVDMPEFRPAYPVFNGCALGMGETACRCYRCGCLLTVDTLTVDRIIPGCEGGTYRRDNIRPACSDCNEETGRDLSNERRRRKAGGKR